MNLRTRVISGVVLAGLLLLAVWVRGPAFELVAGLAAGLGAWEYAGLLRRLEAPPLPWILYPLTGWLTFRFVLPGRLQPLEVGLAAALLAGLTAALLLRRGMLRWTASVAGALYLGLSLGYFPALLAWRPRDAPFGSRLVTLTLLAVAACDIGAYFAGSTYGRHRFFSRVSPRKTVEGAVAGVLAAAAVCALLGPLLLSLGVATAAGLGLLVAVAAQAGDLGESALKREAEVKDSGTLIPGHGGLLDRLDSVLLTGPTVYLYLLAAGVH